MTKRYQAVSLILTGILLTVAANAQARRKSADNDPDLKEVHDYVLTTDKLQKWGNVTKAFNEYAKNHPELNKEDDAKTLDQIEAKFKKYPEAVAILNRNGMSPREYAVCTMTLIQVAMAVGFKKSGMYKEYPPEMLKQVSKANLDFAEQHWDEVQKLTKASQQDAQ